MNPPTIHYRRRSVKSILLGGVVSALLLSGCTISSADPTTEGRQSSKMPTDSEQITTVIRSHLDALRTGSTESAAATVCAEKQVSTTTTGKVLPATTLDAVEYVTLQGSTATATVRGHLDDAPETSIGKVVSLTSTSGHWLIC